MNPLNLPLSSGIVNPIEFAKPSDTGVILIEAAHPRAKLPET